MNATRLTNQFKGFPSKLAGIGEYLTIQLSAKANDGKEVFAFQNITLNAETMPVIAVNEPAPLLPFTLAVLVLFGQHRNKLNK